jgi:hypothetical protein
MNPVYLSRRSAWQYLGIGNLQGIGSKDYPEKPRISPFVDVFPIIVSAKFSGECIPDSYIFPGAFAALMIPEEFRIRVGLLVGSLASLD